MRRILSKSTQKKLPNLFIEGVGTSINTPTLLAAKFNFLVSEIEDFLVTGTNVQARITNTSYSIQPNSFKDNYLITKIKETSGFLKNIGAESFRNANNLLEVDFQGDLTFNGTCFFSCINLSPSKIFLRGSISGNIANSFRDIKNDGTTLDLRQTTVFNNTETNNNVFRGVTSNIVDWSTITTLKMNFTNVNSGAFNLFGNVIRLDSLTTLQNSNSVVSGIFGTTGASKTIYINSVMATNNAGGPHADVADAISKGSTVIYV